MRSTAQRARDVKAKFLMCVRLTSPSSSNSKTCEFNVTIIVSLIPHQVHRNSQGRRSCPKRVGECREMTLRERNRLSFAARASSRISYIPVRYPNPSPSGPKRMSFPGTDWLIPLNGLRTEWGHLFGPSYSGYMSTPLCRLWTTLLQLISSPVSMSSVHPAFGARRG
jgi:hypothetical protein